MGERKRELNEQLDRLQDDLPKPAAKPLGKLRKPSWAWLRIPAGILLLIVSVVSVVPVLNWKGATGLALLAIDVPFLRKPVARLLRWGIDKWEMLRDRFRAHQRG
jgi:hypothetical protein